MAWGKFFYSSEHGVQLKDYSTFRSFYFGLQMATEGCIQKLGKCNIDGIFYFLFLGRILDISVQYPVAFYYMIAIQIN